MYNDYQKDIFNLQQQILQQEQQLRSLSTPAYVAKNRDRAMAEQSVNLHLLPNNLVKQFNHHV